MDDGRSTRAVDGVIVVVLVVVVVVVVVTTPFVASPVVAQHTKHTTRNANTRESRTHSR